MNTIKNNKVELLDWGTISYAKAWEQQEKLHKSIVDQKLLNRKLETPQATKNYLIFCEHKPVYTLGKTGALENLLINNKDLQNKGIEFFKTNRGGDITFHGAGQLVVYPILDLDNYFTDIHLYLRKLEETVIQVLDTYGIKAGRIKNATGVWLDWENKLKARKICACGIRASRWVTMHGIAINVNTDLNYFNYIIPCGIEDKAVTSLQKELNQSLDFKDFKARFLSQFLKEFESSLAEV